MHYSMIIIAVLLLNLFHPGQYVLRHKGGFKHDSLDNSKAEAGLWGFFCWLHSGVSGGGFFFLFL